MSLTVNSYPANISNAAAFNVTTSLSEDSTHVNLRVRADIYHEGIIKASVEKPKGLADFNFSDILKSLTPGIKFAKDSGAIVNTGSVGSNLISSWAAESGSSFDTLTVSGSQITRATKAANTPTYAITNNIAATVGDIFVLYVKTYASTGVQEPYIQLSGTGFLAATYIYGIQNNRSYIIMPTATGNINIRIGNYTGQFDFATANFFLYKITTNRTSVGGALCPYFVNFTEVFENSSGVTSTDGTSITNVYRYVPAVGDGTAFTEYVLHDSASLFANKTLRDNVCKFFSGNEMLIVFFTEYAELELFYSKDGAAYDHTTHPVCYEGWGAVILNIGELLASVTSNLRIQIKELTVGTVLSEVMTVYVNTLCNTDRVVLEFDGLVGGKEYIAFDGLKDISYNTSRSYRTGSTGIKKLLSSTGVVRQRLETLYKDMTGASCLKALLVSDKVNKLDAYVDTEVTVVSEDVKTDSGNVFTNQIEIEY